MKKILFLILMCSFLVACSSKDVTLKDGTYTGQSDKWQYGYEESIVTIKDGKIADLNLKRLDLSGNEVNYNNWAGQTIDGKLYPNLKQYKVDIANKIIEKQSSEVDTISGATITTKNWCIATQKALDEASK